MSRDSARPGDPEISVVMVTYGAWTLTERAIASLRANTGRAYELIIVDNASEDETREQLSELHDAHVILNDDNRGFGPATNQGAERARGTHLLLLNTDAFVRPGWLEPLLETIGQPGIGAVIPRYLHPDGLLQDAGALLARDGTVHVHGDGDDAGRLCYRFRRVIDFGSAACLLIRRSTFELLGGFDANFAPAYYEDADLAMRLRQLGQSVVYEPRSTVTHVRYGSGGSDRAIELSERHRRLFAERWGAELVGRPWTFRGSSEQSVITARDAIAFPRVLVCAAPDEPGAEPLLRLLLDVLPRARLTWAAQMHLADRFDAQAWLTAGVELADQSDAGWLHERLFHYDAIVLGERADPVLAAGLDRTQPQAVSIRLSELGGAPDRGRLQRVLAAAGVALDPSVREGQRLGELAQP